jgi:S-ribosylhomocysteine lyase
MKRIASFSVDHDKIVPGMYISRIDGDITTFDLRTRRPNMGDYMDNRTMHSLEHLFATFIRSSEIGEQVIYFGPMGCQTGFYLLVRDLPAEEVRKATVACLERILAYEGPMFGESAVECGNYQNLSLADGKREAERFLAVLRATEGRGFHYEKGETK